MAERRRATKLVKPLRGGQVTIPAEFRKRLGITEESVLEMSVDEGELRLRVVEVRPAEAGSAWLKELYDLFAPARAEAVEQGYTEAEIDDTIEAAVIAVREQHA